jgi:hypothetical protein
MGGAGTQRRNSATPQCHNEEGLLVLTSCRSDAVAPFSRFTVLHLLACLDFGKEALLFLADSPEGLPASILRRASSSALEKDVPPRRCFLNDWQARGATASVIWSITWA